MSINVSQAFKRTSIAPIDETLALTKAQMVATVDTLMPAYYFTICQDDGEIYLYDKSASATSTTGKFKKFTGGGGSSDVKFFDTTDTLSDEINGTKNVVAGDLPGVDWADLVVGSSVIKDAKGTLGLVTAINGSANVTVTTATTSRHIILDNDGTAMAEEPNLQFKGLNVTDNSTDEVTEVESVGLNQDSMDDVLNASISGNQVASNGMVYSTEEQVVGKWIDGKPIYQKTIYVGKLGNNTEISGAHNISNLDKIVHVTGVMISGSTGFGYPLPYASGNTAYSVYINTTATNVSVGTANNGWTNLDAYVTLQYTKTTDT